MLTRRDFIRNAAAAIALPAYIPIDRLDKIYIPAKKIITNEISGKAILARYNANKLLTPRETARKALEELSRQLRVGDIFTIEGHNSLTDSREDSGQLQQFIVQPSGDVRPFPDL